MILWFQQMQPFSPLGNQNWYLPDFPLLSNFAKNTGSVLYLHVVSHSDWYNTLFSGDVADNCFEIGQNLLWSYAIGTMEALLLPQEDVCWFCHFAMPDLRAFWCLICWDLCTHNSKDIDCVCMIYFIPSIFTGHRRWGHVSRPLEPALEFLFYS